MATDFDTAIPAPVTGAHIIDSEGSDNLSEDLTSSIVIKPIKHSKISFDIHLDNTNAVGKIYIKRSCNGTQYLDQIFSDGSSYIDVTSGVDVEETIDIDGSAAPLWKIFYDFTSGDGQLDVYCVTSE